MIFVRVLKPDKQPTIILWIILTLITLFKVLMDEQQIYPWLVSPSLTKSAKSFYKLLQLTKILRAVAILFIIRHQTDRVRTGRKFRTFPTERRLVPDALNGNDWLEHSDVLFGKGRLHTDSKRREIRARSRVSFQRGKKRNFITTQRKKET